MINKLLPICKTCGKFSVKTKRNIFCSKSCIRWARKRNTKQCIQCGVIFKQKFGFGNSKKIWESRKLCSMKCVGIHNSEVLKGRFIGKENPRWKGGYDNHLWHNKQRRIKKLGNGGFHTLEQWQELRKKYNYTCLCYFKSEPETKLTEDHIIPLDKGGLDNIENIQPLCRSCNAKKHDKVINYRVKKEYVYC